MKHYHLFGQITNFRETYLYRRNCQGSFELRTKFAAIFAVDDVDAFLD